MVCSNHALNINPYYVVICSDALVQDFGNSSALVVELPHPCTKPLICAVIVLFNNEKIAEIPRRKQKFANLTLVSWDLQGTSAPCTKH